MAVRRVSKPVTSSVRIDPRYFRPTEVDTLLGDPTKAREKLGWIPQITLDQLIAEMASHDLDEVRRHALLKHHGFYVSVRIEQPRAT